MKRFWKNRYKRHIAVMVMFINSVVFFIAGTVTHGAESVKAEQTAELSEPEEEEQNGACRTSCEICGIAGW